MTGFFSFSCFFFCSTRHIQDNTPWLLCLAIYIFNFLHHNCITSFLEKCSWIYKQCQNSFARHEYSKFLSVHHDTPSIAIKCMYFLLYFTKIKRRLKAMQRLLKYSNILQTEEQNCSGCWLCRNKYSVPNFYI